MISISLKNAQFFVYSIRRKFKITYTAAGVNIDSGNQLVQEIKPLASSTHRSGCLGDLGGFGGLFDFKEIGYQDPILVSGTDGVGTKLKVILSNTMTYVIMVYITELYTHG